MLEDLHGLIHRASTCCGIYASASAISDLITGTFRPEDIERTNHPLKGLKAEMQARKLCEEIPLDSFSESHSRLPGRLICPARVPARVCRPHSREDRRASAVAYEPAPVPPGTGDIAKVNEQWVLSRPLSQIEIEVPESVRSLISKKIDGLAEEERRALQYASVEGQEFLSTVVARLLGIDEVDLEELLARIEKHHRLIVISGEEELPDGSLATRYRFAHALYQNFLYDGLVPKRRTMLHRQGETLMQHYGKRAFSSPHSSPFTSNAVVSSHVPSNFDSCR